MITDEQIDDLWDNFLDEFPSWASDLSDNEYRLSQRLIRALIREAIELEKLSEEEEKANGRKE
jgi:hypothetical protein